MSAEPSFESVFDSLFPLHEPDFFEDLNPVEVAQKLVNLAEERTRQAKESLARIREEMRLKEPKTKVIQFRVRHQADGVWYDYAAIKTEGAWYLTGKKGSRSYTWYQVTQWLDSVYAHGPIIEMQRTDSF